MKRIPSPSSFEVCGYAGTSGYQRSSVDESSQLVASTCGQRWAEALRLLDRPRDMLEALEEAIPGLLEQGEARRAALALDDFGEALERSGWPDICDPTELALALVEGDPCDEFPRIAASAAATRWTYHQDSPQSVLPLIDEAIEVARRLAAPGLAGSLTWRGVLKCALGDASAAADFELSLEEAARTGLASETCDALMGSYFGLSSVVGPDKCRSRLEQGLDFAQRRGLRVYVGVFRGCLAEADFLTGDWNRALAALPEDRRASAGAGDVFDLFQKTSLQALLLHCLGDDPTAQPLCTWLVEHRERLAHSDSYGLVPAAAVQAGLGDASGAVAFLEQYEPAAHYSPDVFLAALLPEGMRVAVACGRPDLAVRLLAGLPECVPANSHILETGRGIRLEADGEAARAAEAYAEAARRWHDFGIPYEEAQALLGQGRCLTALGRPTEAAGPVELADAIFERVGAKPALDQAHAVLRELDAVREGT